MELTGANSQRAVAGTTTRKANIFAKGKQKQSNLRISSVYLALCKNILNCQNDGNKEISFVKNIEDSF